MSPKSLYWGGSIGVLIELMKFLVQGEFSLLGPIAITTLIIGYAEQLRREKGEHKMGVFHYIAGAVFVIYAAIILLNKYQQIH